MEKSEYTYEKFKEDFEDAKTPYQKQEAIFSLLDSNIDIEEYKEDIQEHREHLRDIRNQFAIEIDASINIGIENGNIKLYTCIEDVKKYKSGHNYYVKVNQGQEGLGDLIWIIIDKGTLKKQNLVLDFDFSKYFTLLT